MRIEPRCRRAIGQRIALVAIIGLAPAFGIQPLLPSPATAAPSCGSTPAVGPGQPADQEPWAQRQLGYDRLTGLADGSGQTVAVIDSGVNATHPQLSGAVLSGVDALDAGGDGRLDCVGHGTAVASIIAARRRDGVQFHGIAPGAKILPYRVSERTVIEGQSSGRVAGGADFANAINDAVAKRATVINISMVTTVHSPALEAAVGNAIAKGVVVVAAVGNNHDQGDPTPYPAAYPGVIGVGGIAPDGTRLGVSQVGPYVDVVAPGGQITAAVPGSGFATQYEGTSYATPFVAGTMALVRQYRPNLSGSELTRRLLATVDPTPGGPRSSGYGAGLVNPYRAVTEQVGGEPAVLRALPPPGNPAEAALARRADRAQNSALLVGLVLGVTAVFIALMAVVIPKGRRRGWRPGLRRTIPRVIPQDRADPAPPA